MINLKYKYEDVIKYWQEQKLESKEDYMNILENFSVLFAYNSGAIENDKITYYDTKEIFNSGKVINYTGDLKTLIEINNQKDCYNYILSKVVLKSPISEEWIKKVHIILTKDTYDKRLGKYKAYDYVTKINGGYSSVENVQNNMRKHIEKINSIKPQDNEEIIKMAAYVHNVIEKIQPFTFGNELIERVLVNYFLMKFIMIRRILRVMNQFLIIPDRKNIAASCKLAEQFQLGFEFNDFFSPAVLPPV